MIPGTIPATGHPLPRGRRGRRGFTLVEALVAVVVVALGLTSLFVLNSRSLRLLRRSKEVVIGGQVMQERIEQMRIVNGWNSTNIVSGNWLTGTNFLGSAARSAYLVSPTGNGTGVLAVADYTEIVTVNPCTLTNNTTVVVDSTASVTATRRQTGDSVSLSSASSNAGNMTNTSLVRVWLRFQWVAFGGGSTNTVETATLFARGQ